MENIDNEKIAYAEIDNFIELLSENDKNKIPQKLRDFFKQEKDQNYSKKINPKIDIAKQNLQKETLSIIALLNLKYLCDDKDELDRLKKIYKSNENSN